MLLWDRFAQDPRDPRFAGLRTADRDRDVIREVLSEAYAEGRLTHEEFDARTDELEQARTLGELPALVADLVPVTATPSLARRPQDFHAQAVQRYRRMREQALWAFLAPTIICWVVWTITMPFGFPWPAIVTAATSLRWLQLVFTRDSTIAEVEQHLARREQRRLEKRRRKELGPGGPSWPEPPRPPHSPS
jgi:hypothetical protein